MAASTQEELNKSLCDMCMTENFVGIQKLLDLGADPTYDNCKPLLIAIEANNHKVVNYLLLNKCYDQRKNQNAIRNMGAICKDAVIKHMLLDFNDFAIKSLNWDEGDVLDTAV